MASDTVAEPPARSCHQPQPAKCSSKPESNDEPDQFQWISCIASVLGPEWREAREMTRRNLKWFHKQPESTKIQASWSKIKPGRMLMKPRQHLGSSGGFCTKVALCHNSWTKILLENSKMRGKQLKTKFRKLKKISWNFENREPGRRATNVVSNCNSLASDFLKFFILIFHFFHFFHRILIFFFFFFSSSATLWFFSTKMSECLSVCLSLSVTISYFCLYYSSDSSYSPQNVIKPHPMKFDIWVDIWFFQKKSIFDFVIIMKCSVFCL